MPFSLKVMNDDDARGADRGVLYNPAPSLDAHHLTTCCRHLETVDEAATPPDNTLEHRSHSHRTIPGGRLRANAVPAGPLPGPEPEGVTRPVAIGQTCAMAPPSGVGNSARARGLYAASDAVGVESPVVPLAPVASPTASPVEYSSYSSTPRKRPY
ncbi:hypothetical protein GWI33_009825 [Rhynchophorus ferrugineus]|uniref:Uncharacterized protein n=1 Tax=Rhynchophorus ferrugineus TaxID=354439 RepID=A0A834IBN5_RHYFE|nr:hypothetical protein GWI33_009825 [Rhynchophorus ferrugineus]